MPSKIPSLLVLQPSSLLIIHLGVLSRPPWSSTATSQPISPLYVLDNFTHTQQSSPPNYLRQGQFCLGLFVQSFLLALHPLHHHLHFILQHHIKEEEMLSFPFSFNGLLSFLIHQLLAWLIVLHPHGFGLPMDLSQGRTCLCYHCPALHFPLCTKQNTAMCKQLQQECKYTSFNASHPSFYI